MTDIDVVIERIKNRRLDINAQISDLQHTLAGLEGELRGLEHAKELFSPPENTGRLDVQGPVMALFESSINADIVWSEAEIVETVNRLPRKADMPAVAVHKFLLRASRTGKLACVDGVYSLPTKAQTE